VSQGKLRVINQGMQSENIQTPAMIDTAASNNKARRRSGQVPTLIKKENQFFSYINKINKIKIIYSLSNVTIIFIRILYI
jgi:hypothetical protein